MVKAFEIAGYGEETVIERFGGMYRAFHYGAPPHGGMAAGVDRIVMLLAGEQNLREVALFPMNQRAEDLLMGAPSPATPKQLRELHIRVVDAGEVSRCSRASNATWFKSTRRLQSLARRRNRAAGAAVARLPAEPARCGRALRRALRKRYSVVCADLRGYGESSKPKCLPDNSNYTFRAFAEDQVRLMRTLGFERFHVVGHDRGGRTAIGWRWIILSVVLTLAVLDIVPTYAMFMETNRHVAGAYWHWYFLSQPEPFPERMIGADPDFFYETCLVGWGAAKLADFDAADARRLPAMLARPCR